jgi:hypothetical protein
MLAPAEVRPFLSHEDGFVRELALAYLSDASDRGPTTQEDLWAAMDRYGEAPKDPKRERRSLALFLAHFPPTERSIDRLFRGLRIEADPDVMRWLAHAAVELPAEAVRRLLEDTSIVRRLSAEQIEELCQALELSGKSPDELSAELEEHAARLRGDTTIAPAVGSEMRSSPVFRRVERIVQAFARHPEPATERGLQLLRRPPHAGGAWDEILGLMFFVRVRLPTVEERILDVLHDNRLHFAVACADHALVRLGTPEVIRAIEERFAGRIDRLCEVGTDILSRIKRPEAEAAILRLFPHAANDRLRTRVALSLCELCTTSPTALEAIGEMTRTRRYDETLGELDESLSALRTMVGWTPPGRSASKRGRRRNVM